MFESEYAPMGYRMFLRAQESIIRGYPWTFVDVNSRDGLAARESIPVFCFVN